MALNPFFLQGSQSEQRLVQELINEQLKMYGLDVTYIPRKFVKRDTIFNEIQSSRFDDNYTIEAYVNTFEGHTGAGDILSKFGMSIKDELTITISKERFEDFISPFLAAESDYEIPLATRPREGDLVYFPLGQRLFEVKFVEHEDPFYQLGKNYVYQLKCELFEYEDEVLDTSIEEIDTQLEDEGYISTLKLIGLGQTAQISASINSGYVRSLFLNNDGNNYISEPLVKFDESPVSGGTATAVAITTSIGGVRSIKEILLTNAGFGYTSTPSIFITGGGGTGAAVTCSIETTYNGVVSLSIDSAGIGYPIAPIITVAPPVGVGAAATATVNGIGSVTDTTISTVGQYYDSSKSPAITFSNPTGGGNETSIVKFGTRAYDGGNSGVTVPTTGLVTRETGAVEFWFYVNSFPSTNTSRSIAKWGANDAGNSKYELRLTNTSGQTDLYLIRPTSDSDSTTMSVPVKLNMSGEANRWNFVRFAQTDSGTNRVASHFFGSGSTISSFSNSTFNTSFMNGDGFELNPDGDFSDGQIFVDEVRFTSDDSIAAPTLPTSTSSGIANTLFFNGGERVTATGSVSINSNGVVSGITITNGGQNYTSAPTVSIGNSVADKDYVTSGLSTATIISGVSTGNVVSVYRITNPGFGYSSIPNVTVSAPPLITGTGTYQFNEEVVGSESAARSRVKDWDSTSNTLKISFLSGNYVFGETLIGVASSATFALDNYDPDDTYNKYTQNDEIEQEADLLLDFTESNPFGNY